MSGKTSTSTTSSPYAGILEAIGASMWRTAKPVYQTYAAQAEEALRTGGVNAQIPSINAAVSGARRAEATSMTDIRQRLAQSGLAGTSFGDAILSEEEATQGQQINAIPAEAATAFIDKAVPEVLGMGRAGVGAIGTAAGVNTTTTTTPSFMDFLMQGLQSGGQAAAAYYGA